MVKLNNSKLLKYCVMILLVARRRVIPGHNDYHGSRQRQTFNMSVKSVRNSLAISFIVFSCKNVKLSFLFVALYLALYALY